MKILLVNKFFYEKGGAEKVLFQTADLLREKGHAVVFFSMDDSRNIASKSSKYFISNVSYVKRDFLSKSWSVVRLLYSLEANSKLEQLLRYEKPDVVHLHNIYHQISPSIIHTFKKLNIPIVMTLHDYKIVCPNRMLFAKGRLCEKCRQGRFYNCSMIGCDKVSRLRSLLLTAEMYLHHSILRIYDHVDLYISPSQFLLGKIKEMGFKGKVICLPNFADIRKIDPKHDCCGEYLIYFGRLSNIKGLATLLDAVKGLTTKLLIIGDGPIKTSLVKKVEDEMIDNVEFLNHKNTDELESIIRSSMFVIVPSEWYENNPLSIIESFALGKPVIGSRIGGIPELVKDNITGLTFNPGDSADLRKKIDYLLANPAKIGEMGRNAREYVEKNLNPEQYYDKLMTIYNEVINKRKQ